jgi:hypothetical protein
MNTSCPFRAIGILLTLPKALPWAELSWAFSPPELAEVEQYTNQKFGTINRSCSFEEFFDHCDFLSAEKSQ